jgi:hypothetical protein
MALSWSKRRKTLYTLVFGVIAAAFAGWGYLTFFNATPTCFDGKQNGDERDTDCGGGCALICRQDARSPVVQWARSFKVAPGLYTAAASIKNPNTGAGARGVAYSFQFFDENNSFVIDRRGKADLPPTPNIVIVEPNIATGNRSIARTLFAFSYEPAWSKEGPLQALLVKNQFLSEDASELSATIVNDSVMDATKVVVTAVLYDQAGVARAASKSTLARVLRRGSERVVFTWPGGVQNVVRAEITVLPSF